MHTTLKLITSGQGLYEFTQQVEDFVQSTEIAEGICNLFIRHTSASLTIQENADPSAKRDLEAWLKRLVPENDPLYTHTHEGPDDMPAHIKAILTSTNLCIPIIGNSLGLGTWQGIYLWEHRSKGHNRSVVVQALG